MSIPKLYTVLPKNGENLDTTVLTDHSSDIITRNDGEQLVVLSYFPKTLKYSKKSDFLLNKYILFVINENKSADYSVSWKYDLLEGETSIIDRFTVEKSPISGEFEFILGLKDTAYPETSDWELTLKIECTVSKNGESIEIIELKQNILPVESDLLSENGASFEDETGRDNSSVSLGNEPTTHLVRGHLSAYLVAKKKEEEKKAKSKAKGKEMLGTKGDFTHQTSAVAYTKLLQFQDELSEVSNEFLNSFNTIFTHSSLEKSLTAEGSFDENAFEKIGICSLNLHHVLPEVLKLDAERVDARENLVKKLKHTYENNYDDFILAYHRCTFPKSAIRLSVDIFDRLFNTFKKEAFHENHIYDTSNVERTSKEKDAKIDEWMKLSYSELRETSNDEFMMNLIAEYYTGYYLNVSSYALSNSPWKAILRIDWSQFIQKLLNPTTITVPFTLIKIQVRDLRSGKPIKNALVNRVEFQSFKDSPDYAKDNKFRYVLTNPHDKTVKIAPTDSRNNTVQKICKLMGYYTGSTSDYYTSKMMTAIYKYMTSTDRILSTSPIDAPKSASKADIDLKKDAWIDYIIQDFMSNCVTDDDGILHCRVPDELLEGNKLNINVGFAQFAVTREIFEGEDKSSTTNRPIKRPTKVSETGPTKFMAHWVGDPGEDSSPNPNEQNLDWEKQITEDKNFGWKITEDSGMIEGTEKSLVNQLRVAIPLEVKTVNSKDYEFLKMVYPDIHELGYRTDHFSTFFKENNIHFTLYGMQWCQPIWDEYDPQEILNGKLKHTFIQDKKVVHPHMHVVTLAPYLQGKFNKYTDKTKEEYYSGKGYGKFENYHAPKSVWRGGDGHQGYDIHAVIGANVFAFHCGKISLNPSNGAAGKYLKVSWEKHNDANEDEYTAISYGHLNEFLKKAKDYVIAGEKVAKGGRTGNIDKVPIRDKKTNKITGYKKIKSLYPSHVHVNAGSTTKKDRRYYPHLRKTMDVYFPENALTMPSNFSPLLFPCHGEVASSNVKVQPKNCDLKNEHVVNMCWAAGELKCPYIKTDSRKSTESVLQLQIQLRYLNEKPATVEKNDLDVKYLIKSEESSEYEKHLVDLSAFLAEDKNTNYFHFGLVNGTIGSTITPITDSDIASGTKLTRARSSSVYNNSTHALEKVRYTNSEGATKTTWIEKAYIDSSYHTTERIQNLPSSQPSKTQMAIYCFRKQHELLKTDNYYQNFETDDEFWEELNTQCGF